MSVARCESDEFFKNRHLHGFLCDDGHRDFVVRITGCCVLGQNLHNLRVRNPLIILGVNRLE